MDFTSPCLSTYFKNAVCRKLLFIVVGLFIANCLLSMTECFADEIKTRTHSNKQAEETKTKYCNEYMETIEIIIYNYEKAVVEKKYCKALRELKKAIDKFARPPIECRKDGSWMSLFLRKQQRYNEELEAVASLCSDYEKELSTDIEVQSKNGGLILIQK
jgi:predicted RND superfamily exporter protein